MPGADMQLSPEMTGNLLVAFEPGYSHREARMRMSSAAGARLADARDFEESGPEEMFATVGERVALNFGQLGIAIVSPPDGDLTAASTRISSTPGVRYVRPEFWMYALSTWEERHAAWVNEGLALLSQHPATKQIAPRDLHPAVATAQSGATWGLAMTGVVDSNWSGAGIKIAVLDTGMSLTHPDFVDRSIVSQSFVPSEDPEDLQGHGTHCIATAAGPKFPQQQIRYGIAHEAEIYSGKVLNNAGMGMEGWLLAGIEWAVERGCEVISVSLGRPVRPDEPHDPIYDNAGSYALDNGSLIIAAAGNESWRQYGVVRPVSAPANSPHFMAVGAVDAKMKVANFSCGKTDAGGGAVDIAGPGIDILSAFPFPKRYERLSGTSMAAPHVAGIAALFAQSDSRLRGRTLWSALQNAALPLRHPREDVGAGLVVAPPS